MEALRQGTEINALIISVLAKLGYDLNADNTEFQRRDRKAKNGHNQCNGNALYLQNQAAF